MFKNLKAEGILIQSVYEAQERTKDLVVHLHDKGMQMHEAPGTGPTRVDTAPSRETRLTEDANVSLPRGPTAWRGPRGAKRTTGSRFWPHAPWRTFRLDLEHLGVRPARGTRVYWGSKLIVDRAPISNTSWRDPNWRHTLTPAARFQRWSFQSWLLGFSGAAGSRQRLFFWSAILCSFRLSCPGLQLQAWRTDGRTRCVFR